MTLKKKIKKLEKQLLKYKQLSEIDDLTHLYNRRKLTKDINRYMELQKRCNIKFLIIMLDINKFKNINDTKGHKAGDKILRKTANILQTSVRKYEKVYRVSGDEFVIIVSHYKNPKNIIKRIKQKLQKIKISVSMGYDILKENSLEIIDKAMYENKRGKVVRVK